LEIDCIAVNTALVSMLINAQVCNTFC